MRPHPRIRKTVKWGGAAVTLLVVGVWVGSIWCAVGSWNHGGLNVGFGGGLVGISWGMAPPADNFVVRRIPAKDFAWWYWYVSYPITIEAIFPLWILALPSLLASATAWRLDTLARRRARVGLCPKCSYNLFGLPPDSVCPECGR